MVKQLSNNPPSPRAKRMVTVDGIRYSLSTGDKLGPAVARRVEAVPKAQSAKRRAVRVGEKPLPKAIQFTAHHQAVMHPEPQIGAIQALKSQQVVHMEKDQSTGMPQQSLWSGVVVPSLLAGRTKKSILASLGIVVLSPMTWLYIFLPALIMLVAEIQKKPLGELYAQAVGFLQHTNPTHILWFLTGVASVMGIIWFVRHLCLIVAYGLTARKIDHRNTNVRHLWLQAAGKIWRFAGVAAFDMLFATALTVIMASAVWYIHLAKTDTLRTSWSLMLNVLIVMSWMLVWLVTAHRPITRVMLSLTNRPASFIIVRSFGLIFRNWLPALGIGFFWLLMTAVTVGLVAGISWATVVYGLLQITTTTGRVLLFIFASSLVLFVLSLFTIWSVGYWPRAYQWLIRRAYPKQISQMMSDVAHQKSRRRIIVEVGLLLVVYVLLLVGSIALVWPGFNTAYQDLVQDIPTSMQELLQ
ncbi:hypothetical protein IPM44_01685 [bacterium]|nr:MAG: hypothetical protein IPM44_01685 [bacterium]